MELKWVGAMAGAGIGLLISLFGLVCAYSGGSFACILFFLHAYFLTQGLFSALMGMNMLVLGFVLNILFGAIIGFLAGISLVLMSKKNNPE